MHGLHWAKHEKRTTLVLVARRFGHSLRRLPRQRRHGAVLRGPRFGEAAGELYKQPEFWPTKPSPDDTGFDLLADVLGDVVGQAENSERFDRGLLKTLVEFRQSLTEGFDGLLLSGHRYTDEQPARLTAATLEAAERLCRETPPPQRVRVVGRLDMIWESRQVFRLILDDGQGVYGVLLQDDMSSLGALWRQRIVVHGLAVYRPSGQLLRLDAEQIDNGEGEPSIWSRIPRARTRKLDVREFARPQTPTTGVGAIIGKWPGEETDEEITSILEELS